MGLLCACRAAAEPRAAAAPAAGLPEDWQSQVEVCAVAEERPPAGLRLPARIALDEERTHRVGAPVDGRVVRVRVRLGDRVSVGQVLADLHAPAAGDLEVQAVHGRAELALAQRELARLEMMHQEGAVSDRELAAARHEEVRARAASAHAHAALANLGLPAPAAAGHVPTLRVPLVARRAGWVVERQVAVGQEVRADADGALMVISDLTGVWATADLFEAQAGRVRRGLRAEVSVAAQPGRTFVGEVTRVGDMIRPETRSQELRVALANPDRLLLPHMLAEVVLSLPPVGPQIWLPAAAIVRRGEHTHVWVVDGRAPVRREVEVAEEAGGRVRIVTGLKAGERVVGRGALFVDRAQES